MIEVEPLDEVLKKYIDKYQFFEVSGPLFVKAVPSGTLECWIKLDGSFEIFDPKEAVFKPSGESGIFPMGSQVCAYFIPKKVKCLNVKLKPLILGLPNFKSLTTQWEQFSANQFMGDDGLKQIHSLDFSKFEKSIGVIDAIIKEHNDFSGIDFRIESILQTIVSPKNKNLKITELADENHLTVKSLERLIKDIFGMTPKKLISVLRFGDSIKHLNSTEGYRLIDALQFGYYDQSHFIRECKKISTMKPKELLAKLWVNTNDLVMDKSMDD